jgi:hypothetical protein
MVDVGYNGDIADVLVHCADRSVNLKKSAIVPFAGPERKGEPDAVRLQEPGPC